MFAAIRRASSLPSSFAADLIGLSWPFCYYRRKRRPTSEEGNGMVHAENIDSRYSSFQLDDCSRRDHRSLAHRSKFPLSGAGTPPPRLIPRERWQSRQETDQNGPTRVLSQFAAPYLELRPQGNPQYRVPHVQHPQARQQGAQCRWCR